MPADTDRQRFCIRAVARQQATGAHSLMAHISPRTSQPEFRRGHVMSGPDPLAHAFTDTAMAAANITFCTPAQGFGTC